MSDGAKLRAWWAHCQGLDGSCYRRPPAYVLEQTGWARSVGGAGPYLTLFSRGKTARPTADAAVAGLEIHELPSARGCTYVVPASDFALALKVGQGFGHEADMKVARKLGVNDAEIDRLCAAVMAALAEGPLAPEELRETTGGAVRNLGEEGKKKGLASTLPLALGKLQSEGEIRRIPTDGRLDQQRYRYTLWKPNPLGNFRLNTEEAFSELARRYFTWIGPATIAQFQWFSGLGSKAAKSAVEPLKLAPLADGDDRLILPHRRDEFLAYKVPKQPRYDLVSSLDGISLLRRDLAGLIAEEDLDRRVLGVKGFTAVGGLTDLPNHAIIDRGRLVGLWEYDTTSQSIVWMSFEYKDKTLIEAVQQTERFIRSDLGDARAFSLDSPKSRASRIEALSKARRA